MQFVILSKVQNGGLVLEYDGQLFVPIQDSFTSDDPPQQSAFSNTTIIVIAVAAAVVVLALIIAITVVSNARLTLNKLLRN